MWHGTPSLLESLRIHHRQQGIDSNFDLLCDAANGQFCTDQLAGLLERPRGVNIDLARDTLGLRRQVGDPSVKLVLPVISGERDVEDILVEVPSPEEPLSLKRFNSLQ